MHSNLFCLLFLSAEIRPTEICTPPYFYGYLVCGATDMNPAVNTTKETKMKLAVIDGGKGKGLDRDGVPRRDVVGEWMRELYRVVQAEPIPDDLLEFSLANIPVGNYDNSTMLG
jgi:hypothetical protein